MNTPPLNYGPGGASPSAPSPESFTVTNGQPTDPTIGGGGGPQKQFGIMAWGLGGAGRVHWRLGDRCHVKGFGDSIGTIRALDGLHATLDITSQCSSSRGTVPITDLSPLPVETASPMETILGLKIKEMPLPPGVLAIAVHPHDPTKTVYVIEGTPP